MKRARLPTPLQTAIPFIPAAFLVAYTLLVLTWKYLVPRPLKQRYDFLLQDPVTINDIPYTEPIQRKLPLPKILVNIAVSFVRLGIEIFLLVQACLQSHEYPKLQVILYSCYVALWVSRLIFAVESDSC